MFGVVLIYRPGDCDFLQDEDSEAILAADFEIGHFIRERIVPRAVLYFTGEAIEDDDDDVSGKQQFSIIFAICVCESIHEVCCMRLSIYTYSKVWLQAELFVSKMRLLLTLNLFCCSTMRKERRPMMR